MSDSTTSFTVDVGYKRIAKFSNIFLSVELFLYSENVFIRSIADWNQIKNYLNFQSECLPARRAHSQICLSNWINFAFHVFTNQRVGVLYSNSNW